MNPDPTKTVIIDSEHSIEIGQSTWNPSRRSVRRRHNPNGVFSPHGSSEIPLDGSNGLEKILEVVARNDELDPKTCLRIIKDLTDSANRQLP
jgi:hypothetical protein